MQNTLKRKINKKIIKTPLTQGGGEEEGEGEGGGGATGKGGAWTFLLFILRFREFCIH